MSAQDFDKEAAAFQSFVLAAGIIVLVLVSGGIWYAVMKFF